MASGYSLLNARVAHQNLPPTGVRVKGTGLKSILVAAATCSGTTLDLAVAATSGITGDRALNYASVHIAAGVCTGDCTLILGDGDYVGHTIEITADGTITSDNLVITVTNFVGAGGTITIDAAGEGILAIWNGTQWQLLQANVVS